MIALEIAIGVILAIAVDRHMRTKKRQPQLPWTTKPKYMRKNTMNLQEQLTKETMCRRMQQSIQSTGSEYDIARWEQLHKNIYLDQGEWSITLPTTQGEITIKIDKESVQKDNNALRTITHDNQKLAQKTKNQ